MKFQGRITYYIPERRFGFIRIPDGREFFFHASNFVGTPALSAPVLSMNVEFEIGPPIREGKPPQAINIAPIGEINEITELLSGGAR